VKWRAYGPRRHVTVRCNCLSYAGTTLMPGKIHSKLYAVLLET
jgi:hypothetical protein